MADPDFNVETFLGKDNLSVDTLSKLKESSFASYYRCCKCQGTAISNAFRPRRESDGVLRIW